MTVAEKIGAADQRLERMTDTLRRLVRRGARSNIAKLLSKLRPADVAYIIRGLTPNERFAVLQILIADYPDAAGEVLTELEAPHRVGLLERLELEDIAGILRRLPVDDAVFLVESLPSDLKEKVESLVDLRRDLDQVQTQLTFPDDTAGRIMDASFFALPDSTRVREAIEAIQGQEDVEMIFYLYVTDNDGRLVGVTSLRQLLLSSPEKRLAEFMQTDVIRVHPLTDQEEVAQLTARYDLLAIPVADEEDRLLGIITVDDIVDVVKEEATEDFYKMVGTSDDELLYQDRSLRVAGIRLPWLLVNLVGLVVTGMLLEHFQVNFKEVLFLLTFVPVIMGMGGNSGSQTSTIAIRGIATGRLDPHQGRVLHFVVQQVKVGAYLGAATGILAAGVAWLLQSNLYYAAVVSVALFVALVLSSLIGAVVPLLFEKVGIDPAVASGPLVTTSSDITGILVYFGLAGWMIEHLVP